LPGRGYRRYALVIAAAERRDDERTVSPQPFAARPAALLMGEGGGNVSGTIGQKPRPAICGDMTRIASSAAP
jgi:hypothetical protein